MDKRYFLIILIIVICCFNLYMVANFSDIVGDGAIDVGNYTFSLPKDFTLYDTGENEVLISNSDSMHIAIYTALSKDDNYLNKSQSIMSGNNKIYSNGSINSNNVVIDSIFCQNLEDNKNYSNFYFNKDGNNFRLFISNFDYNTQKDEIIDIVTNIVDSMRLNYKK